MKRLPAAKAATESVASDMERDLVAILCWVLCWKWLKSVLAASAHVVGGSRAIQQVGGAGTGEGQRAMRGRASGAEREGQQQAATAAARRREQTRAFVLF